jgi:signal transduction histidine kinase
MSLRAWQLAAFAYVLLLVLVALEVPLVLNLGRRVDAEVRAEAASQATLVAASAGGRLADVEQLDDLADTAADAVGGRVVLTDARGVLLADSGADVAPGSSYASRPEVAAALRGQVAQGTRRSATLDEELLYTAVPILEGGRRVGAVRVTQSVDAVRAEVRRDTLVLIGIGLGALAIGLVVAWLLAGALTRPLRAITQVARRVAGGDLDARAEETGAREHREVARAVNASTARLGSALVAQREFVGNAAHQLRTPLTGLRLRLEAASLKAEDPALRRDLEAGEREVDRLARTVADLLVLARGGERPAAPAAPLPVAAAVRSAAERWRSVAEDAGVGLRVDPGPEDAAVAVGGADVALVLDNLLENAIEHAPAGTDVELAVAVAAGAVVIGVADRGPGLRAGEADRVFERFFRGASSGARPHGSGLGLAIVEELAGRWGGSATLANREGGGARAELRLPSAPVAARAGSVV